jgi:heptosyltransferase-2
MTLPALEALAGIFPHGSLAVLARPYVLPLFRSHRAVHRVLEFPKGAGFPGDAAGLLRTAGQIRKGRFELAVLLPNAFRAALVTWLGGVRFRLGYATDARGFLLTHPVHREKAAQTVHQTEGYLMLLRSVGWRAENGFPRLEVSAGDRIAAEGILRKCGISGRGMLVALSPGAEYGPAKRWPAERFARIGDWAAERWGAKTIALGSGNDASVCAEMIRSMKYPSVNLCGATSLNEAVGLISMARFFVTNDSGLMHVASALGVPTVAVFGSTDPAATGPLGPGTRVIRNPVPCAPCLQRECGGDFACMLAVTPEAVWKTMIDLKASMPG